MCSTSMSGKNRRLAADEQVEFERKPVEVQNCRKITDHFRGIYMWTLGSQLVMPKNLPDHCWGMQTVYDQGSNFSGP